MKNPLNYFKGVYREGKRVRWPDRQSLVTTIGIVLIITIFAGICLSLSDLLSTSIIDQLRQAFESIK
jgi:preprotein translocase SecE subunit